MTTARVVAVPFRGLKGHRSEKNDENLKHIVTQRTCFFSEILREISHAIGSLTLRG